MSILDDLSKIEKKESIEDRWNGYEDIVTYIEEEINIDGGTIHELIKSNIDKLSPISDLDSYHIIEKEIHAIVRENAHNIIFNYPCNACEECDFLERKYDILRINCIHESSINNFGECLYKPKQAL